jgi:rhamnosyltransferase subunit B
LPSYEPTFEYFRQQMQQPGRLVVVNLDEFSASNVMAEMYGLPLCRIQLAPWRIRSLIRPAWPFREQIAGRRLSAAFRKYTLPMLYTHQERCVTFVRALNVLRERVGLPPVASTLDIDAKITQRLGFFPDWYARPEADWPANFELVGFPLAKSTALLPAELEAFIGREGRPLVFTPGTGVVNVQLFFEDARRCCEALGMPGVFLSPHVAASGADFGPRIRHYGFLDLELILKQAALLVHHGGIGTTARALQAGLPQIIRPAMYDQFDNGDRVRLLGVGNMLLQKDYSPERLIELVRELTSSAQVQTNLQRVRHDLAGTDAVSLAADAMERAIERRGARQHLLAG